MTTHVEGRPSIKKMSKYICDNMNEMTLEERKEALDLLQESVPKDRLIIGSDGTRVSLDSSIPDETIEDLYDFIQSKLIFFNMGD